jgi:hypothetical protein
MSKNESKIRSELKSAVSLVTSRPSYIINFLVNTHLVVSEPALRRVD